MRVFVTGGTGMVGTAVVKELIDAKHTVIALARSDRSAAALTASGCTQVIRGDVSDTECLKRAAASADAVIHLAFELSVDLNVLAHSLQVEAAAITAFGDALAGTNKPLLIASGTSVAQVGRLLLETDRPTDAQRGAGREVLALPLAARGVRVVVIRLPLVYADASSDRVHGGFPPVLVQPMLQRHQVPLLGADMRELHTSVVNRADAARLYRLALEHAAAGTVWHAVGEIVPISQLLRVAAQRLSLPLSDTVVSASELRAQYGFFGWFFTEDIRASTTLTRNTLNWQPLQPSILAELPPARE